MKLNYLFALLIIALISCSENKSNYLIGKWKITSESKSNQNTERIEYPPLSALNNERQRPEYGSHNESNNTLLFYLAKEDGATIEFNNDSTIETSLFFANYGKKHYEYYPNIGTLKIKFTSRDYSFPSSSGERILYEGKIENVNDKTIKWILNSGKTLTLKRL